MVTHEIGTTWLTDGWTIPDREAELKILSDETGLPQNIIQEIFSLREREDMRAYLRGFAAYLKENYLMDRVFHSTVRDRLWAYDNHLTRH